MATNSRIELRDHPRPPVLPSGDYTLTIEQSISTEGALREPKKTLTQAFSVHGPRFALSPQDVVAVHPPLDSLNDYSGTLPHALLARSTLPWERSFDGVKRGADVANLPPWLVLLLVRENEERYVVADDAKQPNSTGVQTGTLKDLKQKVAFTLERGEDESDPVAFIDVDRSFLARTLPACDRLHLLAHVRSVQQPQGRSEFAVLLCPRTPQPKARNTVHLVSLEGCYAADGQLVPGFGDPPRVRLVCLKTWQFHCTEHKQDFSGKLTSLSRGTLALVDADSAFPLRIGAVPLRHERADGTVAPAWYRGPLAAADIDDGQPLTLAESPQAAAPIVRDEALDMDDVSYRAAWEVGRMLLLDNATASRALYYWKRARYREAHPATTGAGIEHLPLQAEPLGCAFPRDAFEQLARLHGVPFNYLVPDERMLPHESIRFFIVDRRWVKALVAGAFSLGSGTAAEFAAYAAQAEQALQGVAPRLSGFLLRSDVVSGWPQLEVDGYTGIPTDAQSQDAMRATLESTLRLSQDVLMCLFVGVIRCVDLHLPPEGLHFVFEGDALDLTSATTACGLVDGRMADVPSVRFRLTG
jgi:hypothetical protein